MAGRGQRFVDAGYNTPKPLIEIDGQFMIEHAAASLPPADQWIFICQRDHEKDAGIGEKLRERFSNADVVFLDNITNGQASTCLLAESLVDKSSPLNIGACDNAMIYDKTKWDRYLQEADILVWTFRNNPAVTQKPEMYSWAVQSQNESQIQSISVKRPLSSNPMQDHALIGAFSFKNASDFFQCGKELHEKDRTHNGEFYIDELVNVAIEKGLKAKTFEVDFYIGWGTPNDLATYHYWKHSLNHFFGKNE